FCGFHVGGDWMINDFPKELLAQYDLVFEFAGQRILRRVSRIPDPCFTHEVESGAMDYGGSFALSISAEENRRAEDALECTYEPPVLGPALLHPKRVQHLGGAAKTNDSTLLLNG